MNRIGPEELAEMLGMRGAQEPPRSSPPEVLCITLRELADRYAAGCQFRFGDLITPRPGMNIPGEKMPHVVLEVYEPPVVNNAVRGASLGERKFGSRIDLRLACEFNGTLVAYVAESWMFEPYVGPDIAPGTPAN